MKVDTPMATKHISVMCPHCQHRALTLALQGTLRKTSLVTSLHRRAQHPIPCHTVMSRKGTLTASHPLVTMSKEIKFQHAKVDVTNG